MENKTQEEQAIIKQKWEERTAPFIKEYNELCTKHSLGVCAVLLPTESAISATLLIKELVKTETPNTPPVTA